MKLCNKYNVPEETINKMVKDGVLSSVWPRYEEVYALYQAQLNTGKSKERIYGEIAEKRNMNPRTVKHIAQFMDKI